MALAIGSNWAGGHVVVVNVLLLLALFSAQVVSEDITAPQVDGQADLPHGMGTVRRLSCHVAGDRDGLTQALLAVALVPGTFQAQVLDQSPTFPVGARTVAVSRAVVPEAVVAINAGYFDPQFQPAGLCRIAGKELTPLSTAGVLSGIVAVDAAGAVHLLARDGVVAGFPSAVQAGPFVIDPGGTLGVHARPARANRSLIALDDHGRVLLLATGSLTLHQVGTILHDYSHALGVERIERALNLDGGPSTGLSLALDDPRWSLNERGPVRNVLVFSPLPTATSVPSGKP